MSLDEEWALKAIEELLNTRLPQQWLEGYEPDPSLIETVSVHRGASAEKRRAKKQPKSKIHQNRGKNNHESSLNKSHFISQKIINVA